MVTKEQEIIATANILVLARAEIYHKIYLAWPKFTTIIHELNLKVSHSIHQTHLIVQ